MSYLDYGAYIWKNGVDITKQFADKIFYFSNGWKEVKEDDEITGQTIVDGHAILIFENFALEFYKTYNPIIVMANGEKIQIPKYFFEENLTYNYKDLEIEKFNMHDEESIIEYTVKYQGDVFEIIIGNGFGNGWDKQLTSKFVKKYMTFNRDRKVYILNHKWIFAAGINKVMNYLTRKDDINFIKRDLWKYGFKEMFCGIITLDLQGTKWAIEKIRDDFIKIKLLK